MDGIVQTWKDDHDGEELTSSYSRLHLLQYTVQKLAHDHCHENLKRVDECESSGGATNQGLQVQVALG